MDAFCAGALLGVETGAGVVGVCGCAGADFGCFCGTYLKEAEGALSSLRILSKVSVLRFKLANKAICK